jgi:hypothetical protein
VQPEKEGEARVVYGLKMVEVVDNADKSLWVGDINTLDLRNIQPESVGDYSQEALLAKKEILVKEGKDPDNYILYWVSTPILSPNEERIAFSSNRQGFPENQNAALWINDMNGNTQKIADESKEGSITPIVWVSDDEIIYWGAEHNLTKVTIATGNAVQLLNQVAVCSASPREGYVINAPLIDGEVSPNQYIYNGKENKNAQLNIPAGFRAMGNYSWNDTGDRVAFYITDNDLNAKLVKVDCRPSKQSCWNLPKALNLIWISYQTGQMIMSSSLLTVK